MELLDLTLELICNLAIIFGLCYLIYELIVEKPFAKKDEEINGVKLGNIFKLICEIDDGVRLYLDTETKIMYLVCEEGITPVLDTKGKPRKYEEFLNSIRGKEK